MQLFAGKSCSSAYNLFCNNTLPYLLVYYFDMQGNISSTHHYILNVTDGFTCKSPFLLVLIFPVYMLHFVFQFFVAVDYDTKYDRLWYEKYSIRKPMLPSFISMELGTKVSLIVYR